MNIRFIHAGRVSAWRSQSMYHALAYARTAETPDTIVIASPAEPYVSLGFFRNAETELDLEYCTSRGLPVIRRETGGGPVYLDENQTFVQWIFDPARLPRRVDQRFERFCSTLIDTYRFFDINAEFFPPNDIHVGKRKITGTGAGAIGDSEVVTGNFLFDFNTDEMIRILRYPDATLKMLAREGMEKYMTHFKKEQKSRPTDEQLAAAYARICAQTLHRPLEPGTFSTRELELMEQIESRFASSEWLADKGKAPDPNRLIKIHAGVWVGETLTRSAEGITLHLRLRIRDNRIDAIKIPENLPIEPTDRHAALENTLRNVELRSEPLKEVLEAFFELHPTRTPGIQTEDWINAILAIKENKAMR